MAPLPVITLILTIALAVAWCIGEAIDKPWLRRVSGPLIVVAAVGIAIFGTAISISFDDSIRYSDAMNAFVSALLQTSKRDGDAAAVEHLKRFDSTSTVTYEGGALLKWLAEPINSRNDGNDGE